MIKKDRRRVKGISQLVSAVVALSAIVIVFMASVYMYSEVVRMNDIHRIHRKYLLSMEREGYLTPSYEAALVGELTAYGATNIDLNGTSRTEVGYGNRIVLKIECDIPVNRIGFVGGSARKTGGIRHVIVEKDGTALY